MSLPLLVPHDDTTDAAWKRRVRDLVNLAVKRLLDVGETSARPPAPVIGQQRFNTTIGQPEWWDGSAWVTW